MTSADSTTTCTSGGMDWQSWVPSPGLLPSIWKGIFVRTLVLSLFYLAYLLVFHPSKPKQPHAREEQTQNDRQSSQRSLMSLEWKPDYEITSAEELQSMMAPENGNGWRLSFFGSTTNQSKKEANSETDHESPEQTSFANPSKPQLLQELDEAMQELANHSRQVVIRTGRKRRSSVLEAARRVGADERDDAVPPVAWTIVNAHYLLMALSTESSGGVLQEILQTASKAPSSRHQVSLLFYDAPPSETTSSSRKHLQLSVKGTAKLSTDPELLKLVLEDSAYQGKQWIVLSVKVTQASWAHQ